MSACVKCRIQINRKKVSGMEQINVWPDRAIAMLLLLWLYRDLCRLSFFTYMLMRCLPFFQPEIDIPHTYSKCVCRFSLWWRIQPYSTTKGFLYFIWRRLKSIQFVYTLDEFMYSCVIFDAVSAVVLKRIQRIHAKRMIDHSFLLWQKSWTQFFVSHGETIVLIHQKT